MLRLLVYLSAGLFGLMLWAPELDLPTPQTRVTPAPALKTAPQSAALAPKPQTAPQVDPPTAHQAALPVALPLAAENQPVSQTTAPAPVQDSPRNPITFTVARMQPMTAQLPPITPPPKAPIVQASEDATPRPALLASAEALVESPGDRPLQSAAPAIDAKPLWVTGSRVNLRRGPSSGTEVVTVLSRGAETLLLDDSQSGWMHIQDKATGTKGFMYKRFLSDQPPQDD